MEKRRKAQADRLEKMVAVQYATIAELLANGADEIYVQPLRESIVFWEAQAAKLRIPVKRRLRGQA